MMNFDDKIEKFYSSVKPMVIDDHLTQISGYYSSVIDEQASSHDSSQSTTLDITKKLNILLITETWWPDVNGVAMSLQRIMQQMAQVGHAISIIRPKPKQMGNKYLSNDNSSAQAFVTNDITVSGMTIPKYSGQQFGLPCYFQIKKACKSIKPDIVHIATEGPLGLAALMAAKSLNIPVTTGYHTQFHNFSEHFGLGMLSKPMIAYLRWFHNVSKATCAPSKQTCTDLADIGFQRLYEVGRGVDQAQFNPVHRSDGLREQWGVQPDHTVLMMVSRLSPEKGIDLVIQSFYALQERQPQRVVKLVIVGDGPDRSRLETLAKKGEGDKGDDDVVFAGAQTGQVLSEYYASADAFVFASQVETFGNVVTEAMASGLPVYAFNDAAAAMLVTEGNGGIVPLGDKKAFIAMVASLPEMQQLNVQGKQAVGCVSGFSWQRPASQMLTMFQHAIDDRVVPTEQKQEVTA
ncbi:glycosyltransferase family 4 protein [Psychrobacter sp.]|uniref:glycosyltransferase family 4 protein n=1 Tax=Psychrobacter sp. TaxID=56811 RepID=UPI003F9B151C